jgi:hypothetical protein
MYIHNDKKSGNAANLRSKQSTESSGSAFQLVDNRSEAVAQREMQSSMNNASQTMQLKSWQDLANKSSGFGSSDVEADTSTGSVSGSFMHNGIFQLQAKPVVTGASKDSVKLANLVNSLFKAAPAGGGAAIGDGSALAACAYEQKGNPKVGGADHQEKCRQVLSGVSNLIARAANADVKAADRLTAEDLAIAVQLETDLNDALAGTYAK